MTTTSSPRAIPAVEIPAAAIRQWDWTDVQSTNINRIALTPDGELAVQFRPGRIYLYDAGREGHQRLLDADADPEQSVGGVFAQFIRNKVTTRRVEPTAADIAHATQALSAAVAAVNDALAQIAEAAKAASAAMERLGALLPDEEGTEA